MSRSGMTRGLGAFALALCIQLLAGCASTPSESDGKSSKLSGSSLEINYMRGNNRHRFIATLKGDSVQAECYKDKQLLRARQMDRAKFQELVKLANELLSNKAVATTVAGCRTPFSLRLRDENAVKSVDGCRSTDEGMVFGRLIKDAEFLVFSEN